MVKILAALESSFETVMNLLGMHKVDIFKKGESLITAALSKSYDLILLEGEIDVLASIKAADPCVEVILIEHGGEELSKWIKQGAHTESLHKVP